MFNFEICRETLLGGRIATRGMAGTSNFGGSRVMGMIRGETLTSWVVCLVLFLWRFVTPGVYNSYVGSPDPQFINEDTAANNSQAFSAHPFGSRCVWADNTHDDAATNNHDGRENGARERRCLAQGGYW